jgi:hypothetical protein
MPCHRRRCQAVMATNWVLAQLLDIDIGERGPGHHPGAEGGQGLEVFARQFAGFQVIAIRLE